jgi:uncharacterized protein YbjQ (UPF0145 family)
MIVSTTPNIEGHRITKYLGIVSGEAILGAHLGRDFMAGLTNIFGGRSGAYEKSLREAKDTALSEMVDHARALGANAILSVDLDYESLGGMMMVTAAGTAVVYE